VTDVYRALTYYHDHASSPRLDSLERGASTLLAHDVFRDSQWIQSARRWEWQVPGRRDTQSS
jgi:hypothetical protein